MKRLLCWLLHPILSLEAYQNRKLPVINLDNPENNCMCCGHDHKYADKKRCICFCCKLGACKSHSCCFDNLNRKRRNL